MCDAIPCMVIVLRKGFIGNCALGMRAMTEQAVALEWPVPMARRVVLQLGTVGYCSTYTT